MSAATAGLCAGQWDAMLGRAAGSERGVRAEPGDLHVDHPRRVWFLGRRSAIFARKFTLDLSTNIVYHLGVVSGYALEIENSAAKAMQRLQRHDQIRVGKAIAALATEPRPNGCTKLSGTDAAYRVRVGSFRVVYVIDDAVRIVTVTRIGHRKDVYR